MRVFAYIARRYNSAAEATWLLSSVASLAMIIGQYLRNWERHCYLITYIYEIVTVMWSGSKTGRAGAIDF